MRRRPPNNKHTDHRAAWAQEGFPDETSDLDRPGSQITRNEKEMNISVEKKNTNKGFRYGWLPTVMLALSMLLISACASTTTVKDTSAGQEAKPVSDDPVVVERAKARWEAVLARDAETAYTYYSPGYRSTTSVVDYMFKERSRRVKWVSAEYVSHNCTENACKITFKTGFKVNKALPGMDEYTGYDDFEESWVRTQDEWWFVPPK